jgi:hypothetical protein
MATTIQDALRLVKPGELVISVPDLLDKLGTKLTPSEKEQLLVAILTRQHEQVRPGDLITADLLNQILVQLADLQLRVVRLEGGTTLSGNVEIIEPNPSRTLRIGQRLVIVGRNLGTDSTVKIEEAFITSFEPGSDANSLIITSIPSVANIPEVGRLVNLQVSNNSGTAATKFWLKQPQITIPTGRVTVTLHEAPSGTFQAGQSYLFKYKVLAILDIDETFDLQASADLGWKAVPVNSQGAEIKPPEVFIRKGEIVTVGRTEIVSVQLTIPMGTGNDVEAKLTLRATSRANPTITDTSDEYPVKVNAQAPQPDKITFEVSTVKSPGAKKTDPDGSVWIEVPKDEAEVQVTFLASFPADGNYTVAKPVFKNDPNALWSARISGASADGSFKKAMTQPDESFMVYVKAKAGAPNAKLSLQMSNDADPTIKGGTDANVR